MILYGITFNNTIVESVPEPDPRKAWSKEINLSAMERKEYLAEGCKFAERCPMAKDICRKMPPEDVFVDGRMVKCHLYRKT